MKYQIPALIAGALLCGAALAAPLAGAHYAKEAKISLVAARAAALHACPGEIKDQELEKESGGSGLRYSFDIRQGAVLHEVGIDAASGEVLENKVEGANAD